MLPALTRRPADYFQHLNSALYYNYNRIYSVINARATMRVKVARFVHFIFAIVGNTPLFFVKLVSIF